MQTTTLAANPSAVPSARELSPLLKKLQAMLGWRFLAMGISATGSIWAARCLGPNNLGMSAAVQAVAAQVIIFTHFGQNNFLIRRFKQDMDPAAKKALVEDVIALRLTASLVLAALAVGLLAWYQLPMAWLLPVGAGLALFLLDALSPDWLLQAQENQTVIYRSALWGALLTCGCYFVFFRPGAIAGTNLLVMAAGALVVRILTFRAAIAGFGRLHLNLQHVRRALRLLWEGRLFFATIVVITIYTQGEQVLLTWFRPIEELGIYRSALQITGAVLPFFTIITTLLYPRFIEWRKQGADFFWRRQVRIGTIALAGWIAAALVIVPGLPLVYPLIFGPQFAGGALPCALLVLSKMLVVPVSIFIFCLWANSRDGLMLAVTTVTAVASLGLNLWLIPTHGIVAAAAINLGSEGLMLLFGLFLSFRLRHESPGAVAARTP